MGFVGKRIDLRHYLLHPVLHIQTAQTTSPPVASWQGGEARKCLRLEPTFVTIHLTARLKKFETTKL